MENKHKFNDIIETKLKKNKKIIIASMSSEICNYYYDKFKDNYKTIIHTSKSDDKNKEFLKEVEKHWKKYDIVTYSPCVSSGISFDLEYFDSLFVVLSSNSCCVRDLSQMINRVRKFESKYIHIYLNNIPWIVNMKPFTFDEVKYSLFTSGIIVNNDHYSNMIIHNEVELINSKPTYFISTLIKLIINKGHTYIYDNDKKTKTPDYTYSKNKIFNAIDITDDDYEKLINMRNKKKMLTEDEKYEIERYEIKKLFNIKELTKEQINKLYSKKNIISKQNMITDKNKIDNLDDYDKNKVNLLTDLIISIGFNPNRLGKENKLERSIFNDKMNNVLLNHKLFKKNNIFTLYGVKNKKISSVRSFIYFINSVIKQYGFELKCFQKSLRLNKKIVKTNYIFLDKI